MLQGGETVFAIENWSSETSDLGVKRETEQEQTSRKMHLILPFIDRSD
jgi:hypothetical protein